MAGPGPGGSFTRLNVTAATVIKATPGQCFTVAVVVAGSAPGTVNDIATTGAAAAANQFGTIPATVGQYPFYGWPCNVGIVLVPGTGQTLAISYA